MFKKAKQFDFLAHRKVYYIICAALIVVMIGGGLIRGYNTGIDFKGGTIAEIDTKKEVAISDVEKVLSDCDIDGSVTHAGEGNVHIIIKTTDSLENETREKLVDALTEKFSLDDDAVVSIENIGPTVGNLLKKGAAKAVAVAVILMLIYVAIRFQWKYGVAAIIALANTLLILFGFYGIFGIEINSPFIAAMLTILGYGINDTIVIFDRIRENVGNSSKKSVSGMAPLVNLSIHQTVFRSVMTSLTTLLVMIPMLIICGSTIRSFILPLLVGVITSTLSSIFVATSVWYDINKASDRDSYGKKAKKKAANKQAA